MKDDLVTINCEIEAAVNSRPLACFGTDPGVAEVITLSHVLIGKRLTSLPDIDSQQTSTNCETKRRWGGDKSWCTV